MNKQTLWRRIVGRVKDNMDMLLMTMGSIMIPLGFVVLFTVADSRGILWNIAGILAVLFGIAAWFVATKITKEREIQNRNKEINFAELILSIQTTLTEILQELRGKKDERNNGDTK